MRGLSWAIRVPWCFEAGNSPGGSDTGTYTTSAGYVEFNDGRTFGSTVQISGNVLWVSGEVTGTLPSGAKLIDASECVGCDVVGADKSLTLTGGELQFADRGSLVNYGVIDFGEQPYFTVCGTCSVTNAPGAEFVVDNNRLVSLGIV